MRNLFAVSGFALLVAAAACESGTEPVREPPILKVTSPARSLVQGRAGQLMVSGTAEPNANGDAVEKVLVNGVQATIDPDGSFHALIDIPEGATLIQTTARDRKGTTASDTRAVQAGQLRPVGTNIPNAVTAAMSTGAFAKLSAAAGPIIKGIDMQGLLAPLQPMVHAGDDGGEDCAFARLFVDNFKFTDVKISLTPVQGGLAFSAQIDGLDVPGHARYAVLCVNGSNTLRVTADRIVVAGTLNVTPNGMAGFTTRLVNPDVSISGLHLQASGIPGEIVSLLHLDSLVQRVVPPVAELLMGPLVNRALGGLAGPKQLDVLGKRLELQVAPSTLSFTTAGALVAMNLRVLLGGSESSPGFIFTNNGMPAMDPTSGFQLGLADDLANEMLAELQATGLLDLTMPTPSGAFDETRIRMSLAPMISADASDGRMRLVLGDMIATYTNHGVAVGRAAINATVDLKIAPVGNGNSVALQLGPPEIHVDLLDEIANATGLPDQSLANATAASLGAQISAITTLLVAIPVPSLAGIQLHDLTIDADNGYVMIFGELR